MNKEKKRNVEVLVLSDIHLGTYGCKAKELLNYLNTIEPEILVLNGDIIDIWQFSKRYFPKPHMKVIKYLTGLLTKGTKIYYVTGNHDEMFRKFAGFQIGGFEIVNKLVLNLNGGKAWIFHGDVFDITMRYSKWLAKLGAIGYDMLIHLNTLINWLSLKMGRGRISLSKKIKNGVKTAMKYINNFEDTAAEIAISNGYNYVVCGHIHQPQMRKIKNKEGKEVLYLNSGDWIENLSALEYNNGKWKVYYYSEDPLVARDSKTEVTTEFDLMTVDLENKQLFSNIVKEFQILALNGTRHQ
jgi:UDP-2,3-diacylglucosamine pyrophosphatase LpxH